MIRDILPSFSLALSPMDDVTTKDYRLICKRYGTDLLYTEFAASDAIIRNVDSTHRKMAFSPEERPIAIQIFGAEKDVMVEAAKRVEELGPDIIDINWACPVKKVAGKGAGSGILQNIPKMVDITKSIVDNVKIPVSVKTRIGYDEEHKDIVTIAEMLQDVGVQMIAIHGRTKAQMYKGDADWTLIGKVKDNPRITIPIFGNGDITSAQKMLEYKNRYGVDGILIGRGAIGNPFIFAQCKEILEGKELYYPSLHEKVMVCKEHITRLCQSVLESRAIVLMKKFYGRYFALIPDFKPFKLRLMDAKTSDEVLDILEQIDKIARD